MTDSTLYLAKYAAVWLLFSLVSAFFLGVCRPECLAVWTESQVDRWCFGMGASLALIYYGLKTVWFSVLSGDIRE